MKIACLICGSPASIYFVNKVHERLPVSLVIVEHLSIKKRLTAAIELEGILSTIEALKDKALRQISKKKYVRSYDKYFQDKWQFIDKNITILNVEDINSQIVYEALKKEQPCLILDFGTSIVRDHIIEIADLALNLHGGLSPYYRGTYCTEWALINWDTLNIGVTLHKLTGVIDGGDILAQKRAIIKPNDTADSINMQLAQLSVELAVKTIDMMESGKQLQFKKQDYSLGFLTNRKQLRGYLRRQIGYIERNNLIELMLKKPARKSELPIVDF